MSNTLSTTLASLNKTERSIHNIDAQIASLKERRKSEVRMLAVLKRSVKSIQNVMETTEPQPIQGVVANIEMILDDYNNKKFNTRQTLEMLASAVEHSGTTLMHISVAMNRRASFLQEWKTKLTKEMSRR